MDAAARRFGTEPTPPQADHLTPETHGRCCREVRYRTYSPPQADQSIDIVSSNVITYWTLLLGGSARTYSPLEQPMNYHRIVIRNPIHLDHLRNRGDPLQNRRHLRCTTVAQSACIRRGVHAHIVRTHHCSSGRLP